MAAEIKEIVTEGSYGRRVERASGDRELEWMQKHFPATIPSGFIHGYRWKSRFECEFGIWKDTPENRAALVQPGTAPKAEAPEDLPMASLHEKAAELNVEIKGKTPEQIAADVRVAKVKSAKEVRQP